MTHALLRSGSVSLVSKDVRSKYLGIRLRALAVVRGARVMNAQT
jgi:hypothetical protein